VRTYPFQVFEIKKRLGREDIERIITHIEETTCDFAALRPTGYYLPLIIATTRCNFMCKYCYADEGSYGDLAQDIGLDIIESTIDFLAQNLYNNHRFFKEQKVEVGIVYFGGEPLLHFDGFKYLVSLVKDRIEELNKRLGKTIFKPLIILNTNGSLLRNNKILNFLLENRDFVEVVVSFDGIYHDKYRIFKNGTNTGQVVIDGIKKIKKAGLKYSITCVVPPNEVKNIDNNIKYIANLFGRETEINLSFIRGPITQVKRKAVYPGILEKQYTVEDMVIFGEKVAKMIKDGYNIYTRRFLARINEGGYLVRCPAALYEFCVYVDGAVYPCHNFIDEQFKIGNITDPQFDPSAKENIIKMFSSRTVDKMICKDCVFQTVCLSSFDCPSHSYYDLGGFNLVDERTCVAAKKIMSALFERLILDRYLSDDNKEDEKDEW